MEDTVIKTIGLIGAGHIGSQIARLAVRNNYNVAISNSRGPRDVVSARRGARTESARGDGRRRGVGWRHRRGNGAAEELPGRSCRAPGGQDRDRHE